MQVDAFLRQKVTAQNCLFNMNSLKKILHLNCWALNLLIFGAILFALSSCRGPKIFLDSEVDQDIDFKKGKWIMSYPIYDENWNHFETKYFEKFKSLIGDSLRTTDEVRQSVLLPNNLNYEQSQESLEQIGKVLPDFDYLIMCRAKVVAEEPSSISTHDIGQGSSVFHNEVQVGVSIYDLNRRELVSRINGTGISYDVSGSGDSWRLMDTPAVIAFKTLQKILENYGTR